MKIDPKDLHRYLSFQKRKYFIKSFFRKAKNLIVHFVPLHELSENYFIKRKEILPSFFTNSYSPKSLDHQQKEIAVKSNPVEIFCFEEVYCTTDSTFFLTRDLKQLFYEKIGENNILYNTKSLLMHSAKLAKVRNLPRKKTNDEMIFLGGTFSFNYFHFLVEILSKVQYIHHIPNHKNLTIVMHESIQQNKNLLTIAGFFLKNYKIIFLNSCNYWMFNKTWHITSPNITAPNISEGDDYEAFFTKFSHSSIEYLKNVCLNNFNPEKVNIDKIDKVYIARKSTFRQYNEEELFKVSEKYGFKKIYFEDLNIHEQIFIMQNADYIIGPSGAAWTNLLFSKENAKGLIFLGTVWKDFSVFSTIAKMLNFELYHLRYENSHQKFHDDFIIDKNVFDSHLKKFLSL